MTSDQHPTADGDVALALTVIEKYFVERVDEWSGAVTPEHRQWAAEFRDRLAHVRAGGRITDHEARQVYGRVVIDGSMRAGWNGVRYNFEQLRSVERGMAALGYDLVSRPDLDR